MKRRGVLVRRRSGQRRFRIASWPRLMPHHGAALIDWARAHHRPFPWRAMEDPFAKLVAEMLLRKTSARHAQKAFAGLISRWPTAEALLHSDPVELAGVLKPLGMVRHRVAGLREMARFLVERHGGRVPASPEELQKIPHVGRYTANAVCSFAFGLPLPIVDTNALRVLQRFTGRRAAGTRPYTRQEIWQQMARSLPEGDVAWFNYGLLDLGATICRVRPQCPACPLRSGCAYASRESRKAGPEDPAKAVWYG